MTKIYEIVGLKKRFFSKYEISLLEGAKNFKEYEYTRERVFGFFTSGETSKDIVINNCTDLNESGAYPFVGIQEIDLNKLYTYATDKALKVYKYNVKQDKYIFTDTMDNFIRL